MIDRLKLRYWVMLGGAGLLLVGLFLGGQDTKCGSEEMREGDICVTTDYRRGTREESTLAEQRAQEGNWSTLAYAGGGFLLLAGLAVFPAEALSARRRSLQRRSAGAGPDTDVTGRATEAGLGDHVGSGPASGGRIVHIFQAGIVVAGRKGSDAFRWSDVAIFEHRGADLSTGRTYVDFCRIKVGNREIRVDDGEAITTFFESAMTAMAQDRLPALAAAVNAGETVEFGGIKINAQGISAGYTGGSALWPDVREVTVETTVHGRELTSSDVVVVRRSGASMGNHLGAVPNARLALLLSRALIEAQQNRKN